MINRSSSVGEESQWAPVADLMAVLMLVFMFIAIIFIRTVVDAEEISKKECDKIYQLLDGEFRDDFQEWDAELLPDLAIRFRNPKVLFSKGSAEIPARFQNILSDFFPRYMKVIKLHESNAGDTIKEIRIEGHTSSEYLTASNDEEKYFNNMRLSQGRTRKILKYVLTLPERGKYQWARERITANGLSSSRLIQTAEGEEDKSRSRRVEFRLLVSSCQKAGVYNNKENNDGY